MPDTGASQRIVSADVARDARLVVRPTLTELRNASNSVMHLLSEADMILCNNKQSVSSTVLVASNLNHAALVSWQDLQKLRHSLLWRPLLVSIMTSKQKQSRLFQVFYSDTLDNKPMCAQG